LIGNSHFNKCNSHINIDTGINEKAAAISSRF
jgi:hypothetical protein